MPTQNEIDKVIESTDMVDLVSPYVKLTKQGKNYKGLCPFHNEDTPSFVVSQEKHIAHCFGCGKGGNPINFLMQIKQISFNEALNELALKNGIKLTNQVVVNKSQDYTKYYEMMQMAAKFYSKNLFTTKSGLEALDYLHKRGLDDETIKMFQIGLAPNSSQALYSVLKDANYLELDMMDVGLVNKNEKGYYDLFTRRIMFPIANEKGDIIGFSARVYNNDDPNQPKYINTKETFLYKKGTVLYNLNLAKTEILRKKRVILHEGQMDVIAAVNAGFKEAICTMGTALTEEQALVIKKYATDAVICYDGDKAGINASKKAINIFKRVGINPHLVLLPNKMDPDEFVKNYGSDKYLEYFDKNILNEHQYYFETAFLNRDLNNYQDIDQIKYEVFRLIMTFKSKNAVNAYLTSLSQRLNISINTLNDEYITYCNQSGVGQFVENTYDDGFVSNEPEIVSKPINSFNRTYEIRLFMYARSSKDKAYFIDSQINSYLEGFSEEIRSIWFTLIDDYYVRYKEFSDNDFFSLINDEQKETYSKILDVARTFVEVYNDHDLELCIQKLKEMDLKEKNSKIDYQIKNSNDDDLIIKKLAEKYKNKKKIIQSRRK